MKNRIQKLRKKLTQKKLDALLVTNSINIRYLTGFVGANARDAYVVVTRKNTYFLTSALYPEWLGSSKKKNGQMATWLHGLEISFEKKLSDRIVEIAEKEDLRKIGFEESDLTVGELGKLNSVILGSETTPESLPRRQAGQSDSGRTSLARMTLVPTKNLIEDLRMIKDADEIESTRKAAQLTDETFEYIVSFTKNRLKTDDRLTEYRIAWEIEKFIREQNAELAFSPIVAFGKNSANPHHSPKKTVFIFESKRQSSAVILLDFGARVDGYCADMTRMLFVGKPSKKVEQQYTALLKAQQKAFSYLSNLSSLERPGLSRLSGKRADEIAQREMKKGGLPKCPHSLGHGIGLAIHEGFRLTRKKDFKLKPGMVFTIEPGFYIPDSIGMRIEDLVSLTCDGIEILSKSSKEINI